MENIISNSNQTFEAIEGYLKVWDQLDTNLLYSILADEVSIQDPDVEQVEGKDAFIEIHDIWFQPLMESKLSGIVIEQTMFRPIPGTILKTSEIKIQSLASELVFRLGVTHDTKKIYGIEIKEQNFREVIRRYE